MSQCLKIWFTILWNEHFNRIPRKVYTHIYGVSFKKILSTIKIVSLFINSENIDERSTIENEEIIVIMKIYLVSLSLSTCLVYIMRYYYKTSWIIFIAKEIVWHLFTKQVVWHLLLNKSWHLLLNELCDACYKTNLTLKQIATG